MEIGPAAAFDAVRDAVEDFDAAQRIFADARLATEHDGVGLLEDRVRHVGDLGAGGQGILDHAFQHVRRHDHGPADAASSS